MAEAPNLHNHKIISLKAFYPLCRIGNSTVYSRTKFQRNLTSEVVGQTIS